MNIQYLVQIISAVLCTARSKIIFDNWNDLGTITDKTIVKKMDSPKKEDDSISIMKEIDFLLGKQTLMRKNISDVLEALLGVYLLVNTFYIIFRDESFNSRNTHSEFFKFPSRQKIYPKFDSVLV